MILAQCDVCGKKVRFPAKDEGKNYCRECYKAHKKEEKETSKKSKGNLDGMLIAKDVIKKPTIIEEYKGKYVVLVDWAITGLKGPVMNNLNIAINIFAEKGWRCLNVAPTGQQFLGCYALMEKISDKGEVV